VAGEARVAVTAGDIAPRMLEDAVGLAREEGVELETMLFPAEKMPFADQTFEMVSSRVAPHHFSSPADFVAEVGRALVPGGWFLLIDGSVPDDDPETEAWLHQVEKWRDPSHGRFLSRQSWEMLVQAHGLEVVGSALQPMKQPDLQWYFETAATSAENRAQVLKAVETASPQVRRGMGLTLEEGRIVWYWSRLTLLARRPILG
jgi:SAM-dependent methyltransferase